MRVGAAQQVLAVQVRLGLDLGLVDAQQPAGGDAQVPVQPGLGGDLPAQLGRASSRSGVSEPAISSSSWATSCSRTCGVAVGRVGVVADHEPLGARTTLTSLTRRLSATCWLAALAGQRGVGLRGAGAQLLPDDVVVRRRGAGSGGCAAEENPRSATHMTRDRVQSRMSSLTWRISARVGGVAGPAPHPHRDPVAGDRHPDHDLRAGRRGSPWTCRRSGTRPCLAVGALGVLLAVGAAVAVASGRTWPCSSRATGSSASSSLEVGGGGVEEQQVDFEVEQVRDLAEHLPLQAGRATSSSQSIAR